MLHPLPLLQLQLHSQLLQPKQLHLQVLWLQHL